MRVGEGRQRGRAYKVLFNVCICCPSSLYSVNISTGSLPATGCSMQILRSFRRFSKKKKKASIRRKCMRFDIENV